MDDDCSTVTQISMADLCVRVRTAPFTLIVSPMKDMMFRMKMFGRRKADLW
jgi:hypothetical protein